MSPHLPLPATGRKLTLVVLGLAALITTMLCAFALPSLHSGPHRIPVGVTGPARATDTLRASADANAWDIRVYRTPADVRSAVESRETAGGIALTEQGVDVYTATAGGPSATGAITALGDKIAAQHLTAASVHDLAPFTADDPRGSGLTSALLDEDSTHP